MKDQKIYRELFRCFSGIEGFEGWMIAKVTFVSGDASGQKTGQDGETAVITKRRKNFAVMEAQWERMRVRMFLVKPEKSIGETSEAGQSELLPLPETYTEYAAKTFSVEEILKFVSDVGDTNGIHRTDRPVVPGFFMVEWLLEQETKLLSQGNVSVVFRVPAYAGEVVGLWKQDAARKIMAVRLDAATGLQEEILWEMCIF